MIGMSATTGKRLSGLDHLQQSIRDILLTPIGSRVMNRDYGSYVFFLLDHPGNAANRLQLYAVIVDALLRWEKRIAVTSVSLVGGDTAQGVFELDIEAVTVEALEEITPGTALRLTIPMGF